MKAFLLLSDGYLLSMGAWLAGCAALLVLGLKLRGCYRLQPNRRLAVHLFLATWSIAAMLTAIELGFALFYDQTDSFSLTNASQRWEQLHVERNSAGYRDRLELPCRISEGIRRIGFVGDSFTFGQGIDNVEDRFTDRVGASLNESHPGRFQVANLGRPGSDIYDAIARLSREFERGCELDTVVYVCCLNDIDQIDGEAVSHLRSIAATNSECFLFRDTYFFNLVYFRALQFRRPQVRNYFSFLQDSYGGESWPTMEEKLRELADVCARHEVELRVAIFPFVHNLGEGYPFRDAHTRIAGCFRKRSVPVLDLEPVFRSHAGENLTVNRFDAHPNERAHRIAADAICELLLADLLEDVPVR